MKVSVSFLNSLYSFNKTIKKINESNANYIHVDVMDGIFVNNITYFDKDMLKELKNSKKEKEVHLMTLNLKKYIDLFSFIKPMIIYYEFEATTNHNKVIKYIKDKGCKVGIAINPFTDMDSLKPYLKKIDAVLIMSVIPGYGSQKFLDDTSSRISELENLRKKTKTKFLINVDGGVNNETLSTLKDNSIDIVVAGSYICNCENYNKKIDELKVLK